MGRACTIDAHHHLWRYSADEYPWIDEAMQPLKRDFTPQDLAREMEAAGLAQAVAVQARQTLTETESLLDVAEKSHFIAGVVGWLPLADGDLASILDRVVPGRKLVGVRHIVQAEQPGFLDSDAFNCGIRMLTQRGLRYDILIYASQLDDAIRFVDQHPNQRFVVDHCAKPPIAAGGLEPWRSKLVELARRKNVYCKISGLTSEADWWEWTLDTLRPYLDTALEAFGPGRCMAGSDWPVLLLASTYENWWKALREYASVLTETERDALFGGTAQEFYGLPCISDGEAR